MSTMSDPWDVGLLTVPPLADTWHGDWVAAMPGYRGLVAALDALLMLAATGDLDAPAVGARLGTLAADGAFRLSRVLRPLRDAAGAGAALTVWRLLAAALPAVLATSPAPRGTPDVLGLAAETAGATGLRIEVPGLADVVARGGSSRLVGEARRLSALLDR
ncbi:hypothetical protein AB0L34_11915 [Micromonospora sp. NPDC052213]|uniref:hypothetical protein n=1 Tax=Micromonospora sp. NPDC052213 TaxID=3155812 RepID=UPI00343CE57A